VPDYICSHDGEWHKGETPRLPHVGDHAAWSVHRSQGAVGRQAAREQVEHEHLQCTGRFAYVCGRQWLDVFTRWSWCTGRSLRTGGSTELGRCGRLCARSRAPQSIVVYGELVVDKKDHGRGNMRGNDQTPARTSEEQRTARCRSHFTFRWFRPIQAAADNKGTDLHGRSTGPSIPRESSAHTLGARGVPQPSVSSSR
jgi:hypothetical protein